MIKKNIHKKEKSYTKIKIYKKGENSHKKEKTDTKWRKQTPTGNRYQIRFQISGLWAILGPNTQQVLIPP